MNRLLASWLLLIVSMLMPVHLVAQTEDGAVKLSGKEAGVTPVDISNSLLLDSVI